MWEYEGSDIEFLKLLGDLGEEPAFVARGLAPQIALDESLRRCAAHRNEMLQWPRYHLTVLAHRVQGDWARLRPLLADPASATILETLDAQWPAGRSVQQDWLDDRLVSDRAALRRFVESTKRFNLHWEAFLDGMNLEPVNKPRREYNQYYVLEKACALKSERMVGPFEPLPMLDRSYFEERFPMLPVLALAGR